MEKVVIAVREALSLLFFGRDASQETRKSLLPHPGRSDWIFVPREDDDWQVRLCGCDSRSRTQFQRLIKE